MSDDNTVKFKLAKLHEIIRRVNMR